MRKCLPSLLVLLATLCLLAPAALAENPVTDLTSRCEFSVSASAENIRNMVDDDPATLWIGEEGAEQFVEIRLPPTPATISVVWGGSIHRLALQQHTETGWETLIALFAPNEAVSTLLVPNPTERVRLVCEDTMSIAELRVTQGETDNYFAGHTFRNNAVATATRYIQPLQTIAQGMTGRTVQTLQKRLRELGYAIPEGDDTFSQRTRRELLKFQRKNELAETGALDSDTRDALYGSAPVAATPVPHDSTQDYPRTASALVQFVNEKVGKGYIYGSSGELCSKYFRQQNAKLYPQYEDTLTSLAKKWDGDEVFDCIGLFKAFLSRSEGEFPAAWNTNVVGAAKKWMIEMGTIDTMPKQPGILLLQKDPQSKSFSHIGVYTGEGWCVHARGHVYGVVEEVMPQLWTHWARPVWLDFDVPEEDAAPWKPYLAAGDVALVDTSFGGDLPLYDQPSSTTGRLLGVRAPNHTYVTIDAVPEDPKASFWRQITITTAAGKTVTGYVYAKDLTYEPEGAMQRSTAFASSTGGK